MGTRRNFAKRAGPKEGKKIITWRNRAPIRGEKAPTWRKKNPYGKKDHYVELFFIFYAGGRAPTLTTLHPHPHLLEP